MSTRLKGYGGREVSVEEIGEGAVEKFSFIPKYAWSAGEAVSRFLRELKAGRIIGRQCLKCGRVLVPPRMFCELCFRATDRWVYVKNTGRVITFSISYVATDASRLKRPQIVAVVELKGSSPGMGILHRLGEVAPSGVRIGMPVKAVWKPPSQRRGAITDIRYFKPWKRPRKNAQEA